MRSNYISKEVKHKDITFRKLSEKQKQLNGQKCESRLTSELPAKTAENTDRFPLEKGKQKKVRFYDKKEEDWDMRWSVLPLLFPNL